MTGRFFAVDRRDFAKYRKRKDLGHNLVQDLDVICGVCPYRRLLSCADGITPPVDRQNATKWGKRR
jgi:hypothetical protein